MRLTFAALSALYLQTQTEAVNIGHEIPAENSLLGLASDYLIDTLAQIQEGTYDAITAGLTGTDYRAEEHKVETEDGYVLGMVHIVPKKPVPEDANRKPIMF